LTLIMVTPKRVGWIERSETPRLIATYDVDPLC
jgi:hypothetical protein